MLPGNQFPVEAYDNYMRQSVPRWLSTDKAIIDAYMALVDKVCPCVLLIHRQSGQFGLRVAESEPDKIKAFVAVEPAGSGPIAKAAELKNMPVLTIFGDYVDEHPRWATYKKQLDTTTATPSRRRAARSSGHASRTSASRAIRTC